MPVAHPDGDRHQAGQRLQLRLGLACIEQNEAGGLVHRFECLREGGGLHQRSGLNFRVARIEIQNRLVGMPREMDDMRAEPG